MGGTNARCTNCTNCCGKPFEENVDQIVRSAKVGCPQDFTYGAAGTDAPHKPQTQDDLLSGPGFFTPDYALSSRPAVIRGPVRSSDSPPRERASGFYEVHTNYSRSASVEPSARSSPYYAAVQSRSPSPDTSQYFRHRHSTPVTRQEMPSKNVDFRSEARCCLSSDEFPLDVLLAIDGWALQVWHNPPGSKPAQWFDCRSVVQVLLAEEDRVGFTHPKWKHRLSIVMKGGSVCLWLRSYPEAIDWRSRIRHLMYSQDLVEKVMTSPARKTERKTLIRRIWLRAVAWAAAGPDCIDEHKKQAAVAIFRAYDDDKNDNLSLSEFIAFLEESLEVRGEALVERTTAVAREPLAPRQRDAFQEDALKLRNCYLRVLNRLVDHAMDVREAMDYTRDGEVCLDEFILLFVKPPGLFIYDELLIEARVHQIKPSRSSSNPESCAMQ